MKTTKARVITNIALRYLTGKPIIFNLNLNVTNLCTQQCPMCNANLIGRSEGEHITIDKYKSCLEKFKKYNIASLTISGGEPTLAPDIEEIISYSVGKFPFGITMNSNFYGNMDRLRRIYTHALKNNVRLSCSFDGFGETADRLRGATNVERKVKETMFMVNKLKKELSSGSTLNIHTVISDKNVNEVREIMDFVKDIGWTHTFAPINSFFYQKEDAGAAKLSLSTELAEVCAKAIDDGNVKRTKKFIEGIIPFVQGNGEKICPYLTKTFMTYKVFLNMNGDVSLCDREKIGNIQNESFEEMLKSDKYKKSLREYANCEGCWIPCYVEIILSLPEWYQKKLVREIEKAGRRILAKE